MLHKLSQLHSQPLRFWRNGKVVTLSDVTPTQTLLDVLRGSLRACDVKEGCASGDCGACTVVVAQTNEKGELDYRAVNSCLRPANAIDGLALWTASDLVDAKGQLHPVQQSLVDHHATQCGFCTPGFVMSLFALYQQTHAKGQATSESQRHDAISGNLCRCTGYRAILDAAHALPHYPVPKQTDAEIALALHSLPARDNAQANYALPTSLQALLELRADRPQAQLIAGATDVGLLITQGLREMPSIIDLTRVSELRRIETYPQHIEIGAAVPLQEAFDAMARERRAIAPFALQFAGWPIRATGTLGGNVANGSPIGDSMPLLIALGANVVLMAWRKGRFHSRELPLESLYTGYRQNVMQPDEVLACIKIPRPTAQEWLGVYKVSKRFEDDISAVCLALRIDLNHADMPSVRLGVGGVAAVPVRAVLTERVLQANINDDAAWQTARHTLMHEFSPMTDLRASDHYRRDLLSNLLLRAHLERQGKSMVSLANFSLEEGA